MPKLLTGRRVSEALTHRIERKILHKIALLTPRWVTPNMYSYAAITSGILIGISYYLVNNNRLFLLLASLFIFFHWLFDSMDGTLARHRGISSEKYGYYLDHFCDMLTVLSIGIGIAFSGIAHIFTGLGLVILYYLISMNTFIMNYIEREFKLSIWKLGPTEARMLLITLNIAAIFITNTFTVYGLELSFLDIVLLPVEIIGFIVIVIGFTINAHKFYKEEFPHGQRVKHSKP